MRSEFEAILNDLRGDRLSGATSLTIEVCRSLSRSCSGKDIQLAEGEMDEFATAIVRAQPNMGCIWSLANALMGAGAVASEIVGVCESILAHHSSVPGRIAGEVRSSIQGKTILTSSSSSAVFNAIARSSSAQSARVYICESRPMREGVIMARELSNLGVETTVIADAALSTYSKKVDVMLAGSDMVNVDGAVAKIGIMHMGISSKLFGTPLLVLSDTSKFVPVPFVDDMRDPAELLEPGGTTVRAENPYLEQVSIDMISSIFTESGSMTGPNAARLASEVHLHEALLNSIKRS